MDLPLKGTTKLITTAVVLSPPESLWEPIQALRSKYDSAYHRWMPHINLIYPFVTPDNFETAAFMAAKALSSIQPFDVSFASFNTFDHGKRTFIWLDPTPADKIKEIQSILAATFPFCDEQSNKSPQGFTPHLTCAQWKTQGAAQAVEDFSASTLPKLKPFRVDSIDFVSRDGELPFEVIYTIKFGLLEPIKKTTPIPSLSLESSDKKSFRIEVTKNDGQQSIFKPIVCNPDSPLNDIKRLSCNSLKLKFSPVIQMWTLQGKEIKSLMDLEPNQKFVVSKGNEDFVPIALKKKQASCSYTAVIITDASRDKILSNVQDLHKIPNNWRIVCDHMTITPGRMNPALEAKVKLGDKVTLNVIALGANTSVVAVKVEGKVPCVNTHPHITVAVSPNGKPKDSNLLSNWKALSEPFQIEGTVERVQ